MAGLHGRLPVRARLHRGGNDLLDGGRARPLTLVRRGVDMAGSVNKVILVGNLGADPEVAARSRTAARSSTCAIATSENWKDSRPASARSAPSGTPSRSSPKASAGSPRAICEGQQGLSRRPARRPASGRTSRATTATRPRSCCSKFNSGELVLLDGARWRRRRRRLWRRRRDRATAAAAAASAAAARRPQSAPAAGGVRHRPRRRRPVLGRPGAKRLQPTAITDQRARSSGRSIGTSK